MVVPGDVADRWNRLEYASFLWDSGVMTGTATTSAVSPNGAAVAPAGGAPGVRAGGGWQPAGGWGLPLAVLIAGMFMSVLDTSIVNVAISTIQNDFGGTTDEVQWVVTGYTLTFECPCPRMGMARAT
jgi:hypothetical protein